MLDPSPPRVSLGLALKATTLLNLVCLSCLTYHQAPNVTGALTALNMAVFPRLPSSQPPCWLLRPHCLAWLPISRSSSSSKNPLKCPLFQEALHNPPS